MTTSTNSENTVLPVAENLALPQLREIARNILEGSQFPINKFGSESDLDDLIHALNYSEFAISQAARYLSFYFLTYREYLAYLSNEVERTRSTAQRTKPIAEALDFQKAVVSCAVYQLIFSGTDTEHPEPNIGLWRLLCFCSFLESGLAIPEGLLKAFLEKDQPPSSLALDNLFQLGWSSLLLEIDSKGTMVSFDRMVQDTLKEVYWPLLRERRSFDPRRECSNMRNTLMSFLDQAVKEKNFPLAKILISHASSWAKHFKGSSSDLLEEQDLFEMQTALASIACHIGDYHSAKILYESILSVSDTLNISQQASLQDNLAEVLFQLGDYSRAQSLYEAALAKIGETANPGPETRLIIAKIQQHLGCLQIEFGRFEQALTLLTEAQKRLSEAPLTADSVLLALVTQKHLGICFEQMGDYEKALLIFQTILGLEITVYETESHLSIALTKGNLANLLTKMRRFSEAESLYKQALETKILHYADTKNIDVARTQQDLAAVLLELDGNRNEIESLLQEALDTALLFYDTQDCVQVAIIKFDFVKFHLKYDELNKALDLMRNCKDIMRRHPEGQQYLPTCDALENDILSALRVREQPTTSAAAAIGASSSIYGAHERAVGEKNFDGVQHCQEGPYESANASLERAAI